MPEASCSWWESKFLGPSGTKEKPEHYALAFD
jgi:hypothetical protein